MRTLSALEYHSCSIFPAWDKTFRIISIASLEQAA